MMKPKTRFYMTEDKSFARQLRINKELLETLELLLFCGNSQDPDDENRWQQRSAPDEKVLRIAYEVYKRIDLFSMSCNRHDKETEKEESKSSCDHIFEVAAEIDAKEKKEILKKQQEFALKKSLFHLQDALTHIKAARSYMAGLGGIEARIKEKILLIKDAKIDAE